MDNAPKVVLAGRYEVGELIGRGGMAEVHIGHDARLSRTVAIKILRSDLARDPSFLARFRREAQAAAALNHPAIVAVYDTGEDDQIDPNGTNVRVPYIVMEYVEGHTVRDILRDGQAVPIDEAIEITAGVLGALEYSHHAGIVHRDIKPANVMITPTGAIKVMDFGIARAVADSAATMTQTHAVIGTAQYLSPEQARGETVDARSDLYSTGCVLFELLTGRPPFVGDSPVAVAYQHVREAPPAPSALAPDVPEVLNRITLKALAKDRTARYSSAADFRMDLEKAARGEQIGPPALGAAGAGASLGIAATQVVSPADLQPTLVQSPTEVMGPLAGVPASLGTPAPGAGVFPTAAAAFPSRGGAFPAPTPRAPRKPDRRPLAWTLIAIGLIALAVIVYFLFFRGGTEDQPELVAVPAITTSMTPAEAEDAIVRAKLKFKKEVDTTSNLPEDKYVRQEPAAGERVPEGTEVKVWFSAGPNTVDVPDLKGKTQAEARSILAERELKVGEVTPEFSPDVPMNNITKTEPEAFKSVQRGDTIDLFVSNGQVDLPNLVDKMQAEAQSIVEDELGLVAKIVEVDSELPEGTVVEQRPGPGPVRQGSDVTLHVAKAGNTSVPDVAGKTVSQAEEELGRANLNVDPNPLSQFNNVYASGIVIGSDPPKNKVVPVGEPVRLIISLGPEPPPPPTETETPTPTDTPTEDDHGGDTGG